MLTSKVSADAAETAEWRERFERALAWHLPFEKRVIFDCDGRDLRIRKRRLTAKTRCKRIVRRLIEEWRKSR